MKSEYKGVYDIEVGDHVEVNWNDVRIKAMDVSRVSWLKLNGDRYIIRKIGSSQVYLEGCRFSFAWHRFKPIIPFDKELISQIVGIIQQ
jgi:hypothetical protein